MRKTDQHDVVHTLKIRDDLRPLSDMKARPNEVVTQVETTGRPVILTQDGKRVAVLLSVDAFEELEAVAARLRLIGAVQQAKQAVDAGDVIAHQEMDTILERWASGGALRKAKLAAAEAFFEKYGVPPLDEDTVARIEAEWRGERPAKKSRRRVTRS